jgi:hypothetical protein
MAFYKVLELSFIGEKLCPPGTVVNINDNPNDGGMRPGKALAACDADGNLKASKPAKKPEPVASDLG